MKNFIRSIIVVICSIFKFRLCYIVFESVPDFSGSPWSIYLEMKKRKVLDGYRVVWAVDCDYENLDKERNCVAFFGKLSIKQKIKRFLILVKTKLIVENNRFTQKINSNTIRLHTQHGAAFKKVDNYNYKIGNVDYILSLSNELRDIEISSVYPFIKKTEETFVVLGYPANDELMVDSDLYKKGFWTAHLKQEKHFDKIIGWLPTYRSHRQWSDGVYAQFPFGIPLFKEESELDYVNSFLCEKNMLLAIQLHHAQVDFFPKKQFSNIILISPSVKNNFGVSNANLMRSFDAMITDYSSAYYEYLLLNRPVALSIDDYDEYSKSVGFHIDYFDWIKGKYLKTTEDLLNFIDEVANNIDSEKENRMQAMHRVHTYVDGKSTKRVVDFICKKIQF